jgi:hypothetical protein
MASYTDNIPTFNPYVQTIPVDEMVKVGMYKQQKYDEGIQKIQTNIDNIAGLDVVRDVDKAYLQSKLNQLGNNLRGVAGGDFSNFQLVNSVNGMTNQISKDPNVLNAISSAKTYRKGLEDMAAANKDGKGSPSNDWLFKTDASDWLNNQDISKTFSGGYKPYTNYEKNAQEVIKGLVKNETGKDVAFEYDKNGRRIVLDAMTRTEISGITPERIQSALMVGLSPADFQQMQIDGRYNYSNSTPEQFVSDITKSYKTDYDKYKTKRDEIANAIDTANTIEVKQKLQQDLDAYDKELNRISTEYDNVTKTFAQGDVESAKARLHSTKWINNFSQTFASQSVKQTYVDSPFEKKRQFEVTHAQDWRKFTLGLEKDYAFHKDDMYYKERDDRRAEAKEKREADAASGGGAYGGVHFSVNQNELPEVTLDRINDDIKIDQQRIANSDADIMEDFGKAGNQGWLDQQRLAWQASPKSVDVRLADHFNSTELARRDIAANQAMIADISNKADNLPGGKIEQHIPNGSKPIKITFPSGSYTYTPKEMVDFNEKVKQYQILHTSSRAAGMYGGGGGVTYNDVKAKKELSPKEYYLYESMKNQKSGAQKTLADNLKYYNQNVNIPFRKVIRAKNDFIAKEVKDRVVAMQGMEYGISLDNEAQKTSFGNSIQAWADLADSQKEGLANSPGLDTAKLRAIAGDLQNANIRVVEGTRYAPEMYEITAAGKDGVSQTFRVPPEDYDSVFRGRYNASPEIVAVRPYLTQMKRTKANTTAIDGKKTNIGNAYLGRLDFSNVNYYGISGNIIKSKNTGLYSIRVNLTDPITKKLIGQDLSYPIKGWIPEVSINDAIRGLDDATIFKMIYGRTPTTKELNAIKQGSQNP